MPARLAADTQEITAQKMTLDELKTKCAEYLDKPNVRTIPILVRRPTCSSSRQVRSSMVARN